MGSIVEVSKKNWFVSLRCTRMKVPFILWKCSDPCIIVLLCEYVAMILCLIQDGNDVVWFCVLLDAAFICPLRYWWIELSDEC